MVGSMLECDGTTENVPWHQCPFGYPLQTAENDDEPILGEVQCPIVDGDKCLPGFCSSCQLDRMYSQNKERYEDFYRATFTGVITNQDPSEPPTRFMSLGALPFGVGEDWNVSPPLTRVKEVKEMYDEDMLEPSYPPSGQYSLMNLPCLFEEGAIRPEDEELEGNELEGGELEGDELEDDELEAGEPEGGEVENSELDEALSNVQISQ